MQSKRTSASQVALGGVLAALAVVLMSMGTLIPVATYTCPMLCALLLEVVRRLCGQRTGWAWYGAVSILCGLLAPDKEAAAVFVFFGCYPLMKPWLDRRKGKWIWKVLYFNGSALVMYWILLHVLGLEQTAEDFGELNRAMTALLLLLGNVTFFLLDRVLDKRFPRKK